LDKKQFFSETPGRMLVSVAPENAAAFEEIMQDDAMPAGEVAATQWLEIHLADAELNLPVAQMQKLWEEALPCAMKSKD
jgi:phosphoribosylformylglycinamidine (FGAM) synthase-like enzyme